MRRPKKITHESVVQSRKSEIGKLRGKIRELGFGDDHWNQAQKTISEMNKPQQFRERHKRGSRKTGVAVRVKGY